MAAVRDGGQALDTLQVRVNNVAPDLSNVVAAPDEIDENDMVMLTGDIIDPGTLDTFTLDVDWGDGSANREVTGLGFQPGLVMILP